LVVGCWFVVVFSGGFYPPLSYFILLCFFGRFYIYVFSQKLITRVDFNSCKTKRKKEKRKQFKQQQKVFGFKKEEKAFFFVSKFFGEKNKNKKALVHLKMN